MSEAPAFLGRMVCYGDLPGGEIWASGFWISYPAAPADGTAWQVIVQTVGTAMFAHSGWFQPQNVAGATWLGVKGYYHAANPGAPAIFAGDGVFGSALAGTGSGDEMPNQIACVATLQTGQSGRSYRGRMYIPTTNLAIAGGFVGSSQVNAMANGLADCLTAAATAAGGTLQVVSISKDVMTAMIAVRVDDKPDTQRRRSNRLGPTYQAIAAVV